MRVAVVGCGGLGVPVAWSMVETVDSDISLSGASFTFIDGDRVERSNLPRQVLFEGAHLGRYKAEALTEILTSSNPGPSCSYINQHLDRDSLERLLEEQDVIIDATDSLEVTFLLNDYCLEHDKPFVTAGVAETYGHLLLRNPADQDSPCLRCIFPEMESEQILAETAHCQALGVLGPVPAVLGFLQAELVVACLRGEHVSTQFWRYSLLRQALVEVSLQSLPACPHRHSPDRNAVVSLDLQGVECPKTFLLTKLSLEELSPGDTLEVTFSTEDSARQVSRSCAEEGFSVTNPREDAKLWHLRVTTPESSRRAR